MESTLFNALLLFVFFAAGLAVVGTGMITAPYGRHARPGWGPVVGARWGWMIMESPSVFLFLLVFCLGPRSGDLVPRILAVLWLAHYVHRDLIYPLRMRPSQRTMPWVIVAMAFTFNMINSYLNARSLSALGPSYEDTLGKFHFWYGLVVFVSGYLINRDADRRLRGLRAPGEHDYKVARGGLFDVVSCPNYLGEVIQWFGWAIMTWSGAGLAFAVFTAANLVPRAVSHHRWYQRKFPDYPRERRAIFPFLL